MHALPNIAFDATVEVRIDPTGTLNVAQVDGLPASEWTSWAGRDYITAQPGSAAWIKIALTNPSNEPLRGVLADSEYFSDRAELWERGEGEPQTWRHEVSGEALRGADKALWARSPAFVVELPARGTKQFYLRLEDRFVAATKVVWWPRLGDYVAAQTRSVLAEAACYGALVALLLYHAILWARLRHADIAWYVLSAGALVTFNFVANGGLALLGYAAGSPVKETIATLALALHSACLVQFARVFLELKARQTGADRIARWLSVAALVLAVGALTTPWMHTTTWLHLTVPTGTAVHVSLLIIAVLAWRKGAAHARFFVLASGAMLVSTLPAVLNWLSRDIVKAGAMGVLGGSALEILLLSLAVADRFSQAQREKAEAQRKLIDEAATREAVQEAYADELEVEVRERTRELEAANADKDRIITVLGHDLRGPLTGLMRAAEQAAKSPATMTDFSAEAASTGRHLLLLIEDLVLWARLRAGGGQLTACSVHALVAPAAALHRTSANRGGVELCVTVPDTTEVETDVVLVQTLIRNLVDNAVKHARRRVEISAASVEGGVQLNVRDDGPGLPAEVARWITQEEIVSWPVGGGLGLRLCREIARTLNLQLEVRTRESGGTEFGFTLKRPRAALNKR
jgi:signal transduction histidine kinase